MTDMATSVGNFLNNPMQAVRDYLDTPNLSSTATSATPVPAPVVPQISTNPTQANEQEQARPVIGPTAPVAPPQMNTALANPPVGAPPVMAGPQGPVTPPTPVQTVQPATQQQNPVGAVSPMIAGNVSSDVGLTPTEQAIKMMPTGPTGASATSATSAPIAPPVAQAPAVETPVGTQSDYDLIHSNDPKQYAHLAYDATKPQSIQMAAREQMYNDLKNEQERRKAEEAITKDFANGDVNAAMRKMNSKEEGSYVKAYLFKRFGLDDLAAKEQEKISPTRTTMPVMLGDKHYAATYNKDGEIVSARGEDGMLVDPKTLAKLQANAFGSKGLETGQTMMKDAQGNIWSHSTQKGTNQVVWTNQSTGETSTKAPTGLTPFGQINPVTRAQISLATSAERMMMNQNNKDRAQNLTPTYSQEQITATKEHILNGGSPSKELLDFHNQTNGGAVTPTSTGGNLQTVIGKNEGGAAGYDAIYGYSNAGGDKSIPAANGGRNLSQLTIGEALKIGDSRMKDNAGALGKYQFLPNTLRSAMKTAGLDESKPFSAENQDKLFEALKQDNAKLLKAEGVPVTDSNLYLAHAVGAGKVPDLLNPANQDKIAADVVGLAKGSAARKTNPQLEQPVKDYVASISGNVPGVGTTQTGAVQEPPAGSALSRLSPADRIIAEKMSRGEEALPTGQGANNTRAQMLARAAHEMNPSLDPTWYGQHKKTEDAFNTGKQGDTVRSMNVAIDHMDTLRDKIKKLPTGQYPAINDIITSFSRGIGDPRINSYDAAAGLIAAEVTKAIVANGGTGDERAEKEKLLAVRNNPEALRGVLDSYTKLLGGQMRGLKDQYTAGRGSDFESKVNPRTAQAMAEHKIDRGWTDQDKAAAKWAKENPKDPRTAKIKERLGLD